MAEIAIITILLYGISILTKEAIGKGDVAVIANMFMLSGLAKTVEIVIISLFICSIVSIACVLLGKINIRSSLPFVPFLCFGNVVWMIFAM
jgi:prepilin signal peptidase PulO-like enzyme (type II secretory pathway)